MKRDTKLYLQDILECIELIGKYTNGMSKDDFGSDVTIQDAVMRRLEIIGEATKNLPNELKQKYPDIPWKDITGMRDVLTHDYFGIDLERVWGTITRRLPGLKAVTETMITSFSADG